MGSGELITELGHRSYGGKLEVPLLEASVKIEGFHSLGTNCRSGSMGVGGVGTMDKCQTYCHTPAG